MAKRNAGDGDEGAASVTDISTKAAMLAAGRAKAHANNKARAEKRQAARESEEDGPSRWEQYVAGTLTIDQWDDQELARMQTRNFHGQFAGRPPTLRPPQIREIKAELLRRGERDFSKYGIAAIKVVARIMNDDTERATDRLRAANIFLERCYGKVPETVKVAVEAVWQEDVDAVMTFMGDPDGSAEEETA